MELKSKFEQPKFEELSINLAEQLLQNTKLPMTGKDRLAILVSELHAGKERGSYKQLQVDTEGVLRTGRRFCDAVINAKRPYPKVIIVTGCDVKRFSKDVEEEDDDEQELVPVKEDFKLTKSIRYVCELAAKMILKVETPSEEYIQKIGNVLGEHVVKIDNCVTLAKKSKTAKEQPTLFYMSALIRLTLALKLLSKEDEDYVVTNYIRFLGNDGSMPLLLANLRQHIKEAERTPEGKLVTGKKKIAQTELAQAKLKKGEEAYITSVDEDMCYRILFAFTASEQKKRQSRAYPELVVNTINRYKDLLTNHMECKVLQQGDLFETPVE